MSTQQMDSIFTEDELYSVDMAELGVRPLDWMELDQTIDISQGKEQSIHLNVFPAEFHFAKNYQKLTTNEDDFSMSKDDDDETNDYIIDPETGERVFQETNATLNTSLPSPAVEWLEEYLLDIQSASSNKPSSDPTTTTENSDIILEDLPFSILENLVGTPTNSEWISDLFPLDENSDQSIFDDLISSTELTSSIPIPLSDETQQNSIEEEYSINSSSSNNSQRFYSSLQEDNEITLIEAKLEQIDPDEHLFPHSRVRRTSIRSTSQRQQDEDALQQHNIPLTVNDITQSTTEEYNRLLARLIHLSSDQIHMIKDIRRRGKNKIAAQNCRKRKAVDVGVLVEDVDELKRVKHELEERKRFIQQQIDDTRNQYEYLHRQALPNRQLPPAIIVQ